MKTLPTLALLIAVSTPATAQPVGESLVAAAARGGRELAKAAPTADATPAQLGTDRKSDWRRVTRFRKGAEVRVITRDRLIKDGRLGDVTDDRVLLLSVSTLPGGARRALLDVAANYPGYVGRKAEFEHEKLRVDPSGVFYDGIRVAGPAAIFTEIPRHMVAEIKRPTRGSLPGALLGAGGGFALGWLNTLRLIYSQCGGSCSDETAEMGLSLVGLPVLGGYLGARYMPHEAWTTIYRAR
jgi:hypothetical protein